MPQTCNTPRGEDMQLYTPNKSLRAKMSHIILNQPPGAEGRRGGQGIDGATAKGGRPKGSSSSNWILMSCQPHRVTSGQSNSGHKQIHISKLFSRVNLKSAGARSFQYQEPCVWNSVPIQTRLSPSLTSFKSSLKTHLFRNAFT